MTHSSMHIAENYRIAFVGLGYSSLPLAVEYSKQCSVIGFDANAARIADLQSGHDETLEVSADELAEATNLSFSSDVNEIADCNFYIVTGLAPVDAHRRPKLTPLSRALDAIEGVVEDGDVVVYETTDCGGATEEDCVPVPRRYSGLIFNRDLLAEHSPERINSADRRRA